MKFEQYKTLGFTNWCVENRTAIYIFTFLITLGGLFVYNNLPKEQFPDIKIPQVYINTVYVGTAPADIENTINKQIEKQLKSISGVKRIKSNALQDVSVILVEFNPDVQTAEALQRVRDAIDKAKPDLPQKLDAGPTAQDVNFSEFPIMNINMAGNFSLKQLKEYAEDLQDAIESMPEIRRVDIVGALEREIQINVDLAKMQSAGLAFTDIQQAVQGENVNVSGGDLNVDGVRRTVRVKGEFTDVVQIQNLQIRTATGATVRLGDVAEVQDSFEEQQDFARLDNKSVVTLNVIKRAGSNLISAADNIEKTIDEYKESRFPQGLDIKVTADQSERTRENVNDLINTVVLGFIFVVLVLMFFMGVRDAIFVGLSVPLSALVAFVMMPILGPAVGTAFTLNTIVLFAFLLGLGLVVDDAIVVIENSHRLFNENKDWDIKQSVKAAAGEVFAPVFSGTLTTIAPFFPLLFWPGIVGEFMKFLPLTLILTLFASLFVAYVINPVFAVTFMKRHEDDHSKDAKPGFDEIKRAVIILAVLSGIGYVIDRGIGNLFVLFLILYVFNHYVLTPKLIVPFQVRLLPGLKSGYRRLISWILTGYRPVFAVVAAFALLIVTFVIVGIAKPKVLFFPSGEPDYIYVYNVMPVGTDARVTDSVTKVIEKRVFKVLQENDATDIVNSVISNVGKNAGDPTNPDRSATPQKSKVTVAFKGNEERKGISTDSLLSKVRVAMNGLPGSEISVERESNGPPTGKPIAIEIAGEDFGQLQNIEKQLRQRISQAGIQGIDQLKSDLITNKPEIVINIDRDKAEREGISSGQVALAIRTALFGTEVSRFRDAKDEYPIMVRLKPDDRSQIDRLLSLNVVYRDMSTGGQLRQVPITSVANISYSTTFSQINRKNQERLVTLNSDVVPGFNANQIVAQIQQVVNDIEVPNGYTIKMGGEQEDQQESMTFLISAFGIAILLIYLILATQFNSVVKPLIIFVTILLSLIGVFLGFVITGKSFSVIMSGVGIIALAGIVVKNGILLIEFIEELRGRGVPLREAIIEGGGIRLTPVLLTASAAVLGLIPLAFGLTVDFVGLFRDFDPHVVVGGDSSVFWNILAWTIIYGLTFSTVLTLVIVPCLYWINERVRMKWFGKKDPALEMRREKQPEEELV
ncbi:efflux RND transporter permease subunit [Spirosoma utsteinense]|uniref:Multidrug efflux pump subunit AcrB n=1 Tax=Spirosoma utsteinense TaxID=2585773 RepID=A0ABR6W0X3_9BACT|nr:efflux RND transporter permease subunit [Spirosoma utsteinense]MBC3783620.1 multidrug efflux pump subunit AcrB [Spirosoma utsteinense]MBC3790238.1 multidrug efflux pump subunit AcrB [Spirosoma utsteinense]